MRCKSMICGLRFFWLTRNFCLQRQKSPVSALPTDCRQRPHGGPFALWVELEATYRFAEKYAPDLLRKSYSEAREIVVAQAEEAGKPPVNGQVGRGRRIESFDNIKANNNKGGTSSDYTLRRLLRDAPELFEAVKAGDMTPNQAAIQAGFRQPMVSHPVSPEAFALWVELEATYRFAEKYAPELLGKSYEEAKSTIAASAQERVRAAAETATGEVQERGGDRKSEE